MKKILYSFTSLLTLVLILIIVKYMAPSAPAEFSQQVPSWLESSRFLHHGEARFTAVAQLTSTLPSLFDTSDVRFPKLRVSDGTAKAGMVNLSGLPLGSRLTTYATVNVRENYGEDQSASVAYKDGDLVMSIPTQMKVKGKKGEVTYKRQSYSMTEILQRYAASGKIEDPDILPLLVVFNSFHTELAYVQGDMEKVAAGGTPVPDGTRLYLNDLTRFMDSLTTVFRASGNETLTQYVEASQHALDHAQVEMRGGGLSINEYTGGMMIKGERLQDLTGRENYQRGVTALTVAGEQPLTLAQVGGIIIHAQPGESVRVLFHAFNKSGTKKGATREIQIQRAGDTQVTDDYNNSHKKRTGEEISDDSLVAILSALDIVDLDVKEPTASQHQYGFGVTIAGERRQARIPLFVAVPLRDRTRRNTVLLLTRYPQEYIASSASDSLAFPRGGVDPDDGGSLIKIEPSD